MSHRMYLYNKATVGSVDDDCLPLMEWGYELPLLLQPLFSGAPFVGANCYNALGSKQGLYAEAEAGIQALRRFYAFIERHAETLLDNLEAFRAAQQKIFQLLDQRAIHAWFHLDAWDVFNMAEGPRRTQAEALLADIVHANSCIDEAIASDNPWLLDNCPGLDAPWAGSFRAVLNLENYDYGWEPISSLQPQTDDDIEIFRQHGLFGLRDSSGNIITAPRYQVFNDFDWTSDLACVQRDERFGYVNRQGQEVIACQFAEAGDFVNTHAVIREGQRFGLIDQQGRITLPCQFDAAEALDTSGARWCVLEGNAWGVIDHSGHWLLPAQYQQINAYEGYFSAQPQQGPEHLFTNCFHDLGAIGLGNIDSITLADDAGEAYVIRRRIEKKSLYRVVDQYGQALLPGEYQSVEYLYELQAWRVREKSRYGLYQHLQKHWLLPCAYAQFHPLDYASRDSDGSLYYLVKRAQCWGLYRGGTQPGWAIEPYYQHLNHLHKAHYICCLDGLWGIVDNRGQFLRAPQDQAPATQRGCRNGEQALMFYDNQTWVLIADGSAQPLPAARALQILEQYAQDNLDPAQQQALQGSAGAHWHALQAYQQGRKAYEIEDYASARTLLSQACAQGNIDAYNSLGCLHQEIDQNHSAALACYVQASNAGLGIATRNVGNCHAKGLGTPCNPALARHYLLLAIEQGYRAAHLDVAAVLIHVEPPVGDLELALEHYLAAWRHGDKNQSAGNLGWLYEERKEHAQALRYYSHAANTGNAYGQWRLGCCYRDGLGVPSNREKASEYLLKACSQQFSNAYLDLAELLLVDTDNHIEGLSWLQKAVEADVAGARERAKQLIKQQKKPGLLRQYLRKYRR